jgi:hypothetical protein
MIIEIMQYSILKREKNTKWVEQLKDVVLQEDKYKRIKKSDLKALRNKFKKIYKVDDIYFTYKEIVK